MEKIKHLVLALRSIALRFAIILLIFGLVLRIVGSFWQSPKEDYKYIIFNDTLIETSGRAYSSGAIMIQLDWVCDIIEAELSRNNHRLIINWEDKELSIKPYSKKAYLNGETIYLDNAPIYKNGTVFAHIRTVCDELGLVLGYIEMTTPSEKIDYSKLNDFNYFCIYTQDYLASHRP